MKTIDVNECPCCGYQLKMADGKGVWDGRSEVSAGPQMQHADGSYTVPGLMCKCLRCGCKWQHGQFDAQPKEKPKEKPKEQGGMVVCERSQALDGCRCCLHDKPHTPGYGCNEGCPTVVGAVCKKVDTNG